MDNITETQKRLSKILDIYSEYVDGLYKKHLEAMDEMMVMYKSRLDILMERNKEYMEQVTKLLDQ